MTWDELEEKCKNCTACAISRQRHNVVIGTGNKNSKIMFVGEAPGYHEDMQGEPFVGNAGALLDKMLASIGLSRQKVYICNILKCRPTDNRDPSYEEQASCIGFLREQYKLIRPMLIVCLGRIAAQALISPNFKITRQRGSFIEKKGVLFIATYHPSALLRDESKKKEAWEDLKTIKRKMIEMEIYDEQKL